MESLVIKKPGFTKDELMNKLKGFRKKYEREIHEHNIQFTQLDDGYLFSVNKTLFFAHFYVNGEIRVEDGGYKILYETNAPRKRVRDTLTVIEDALVNA